MNAKQGAVGAMFIAVDEFCDLRADTFPHNPAQPVDTNFANAQAIVKQAITDLGGKAAIQAAGGVGEEVDESAVLRETLEDELRKYNKTAASIAEQMGNPALMDRFRMPHGSTAAQLKAKGRSFATAIRELKLQDDFHAHGHSVDAATDIETMAGAVESGEGEKAGALSKQAGATAAIPVILKKGKGAVKTLESIMSNVFDGNAEMLGGWKTASHVKRVGSKKKNGEKPAPKP